MTVDDATLQGWKEIAAHLGKSVRAVQRWETEMGLPVRRLRTAAGQTVFARRDEIDAWRASQEVRVAFQEPPPETSEPAQLPVPARPNRPWHASAIGVAAVTIAIAFIAWSRASTPGASQFSLEKQRLVARDAAGRELWSYSFPHKIRTFDPNVFRHLSSLIYRADLDGDGRPEVLVIASYAPEDGWRNDTLWCFTDTGHVLWTYEPGVPLTFGSDAGEGFWQITDVLVGPGPGPQRLWVSAAFAPWWPSAVFEIDKTARARTIFVQSGVVYSLALSKRESGLRLWAAGVNNEYASASLALLDPAAYAVSPQSAGGQYQCTNCAAGRPLEYMLFPRSELNAATRQPYNRVAAVDDVPGGVQVIVREGPKSGTEVVYELDGDRSFRATPTDTFWLAHDELTRDGVLKHSVADCPERAAGRTLRVWTPAEGWTDVRERPHAIAAPGLPR